MIEMHYIYKITNKINNKVYIGQFKDTSNRWSIHKNSVKKVLMGAKLRDNGIQVIHLAMARYGIENFYFEIIEKISRQDTANKVEDLWIKHFDSLRNGYNCQPGGKVVSGPGHPCFGRKLSKEFKQYLSILHKGKHFSPETEFKNGQRAGPKTEFKKGHHTSLETEFKKGHVPWNKETKGICRSNSGSFKSGHHYSLETELKKGGRFSPGTEFKKGHIPHNRKLTIEQANEIRAEYQKGISSIKLSKKYNVNKKTILEIIHNKIYLF